MKKLKIFIVILSLGLIFISCPTGDKTKDTTMNYNNSNTYKEQLNDSYYTDNQPIQMSEIEMMKNNASIEICSEFRQKLWSEYGNEQYPDDYAGAYINDENNLVLVFTKGSSDKYKTYITKDIILENFCQRNNLSENIKNDIEKDLVNFIEKPFSYNYLIGLQNSLNGSFCELNIIKTSLNEITNTVDIYLNDINYKKNVIDYLRSIHHVVDAVAFYEICEKIVEQTYPGDKILDRTESYGTIGFNASYNGEYGIVTNGHIAPSNEILKVKSTNIGMPLFSIVDEIITNKSVDVAFIPFPDQSLYKPSQIINNDVLISFEGYPIATSIISNISLNSELILGANNYKYGANTGRTIGKITSISVSVYVSYNSGGKTMCDVVSYSNAGEYGDSGGPFGTFSIDSGGGYYVKLMGINFAGVNDGSGNAYGIKLSNIMRIPNLYPITNDILEYLDNT